MKQELIDRLRDLDAFLQAEEMAFDAGMRKQGYGPRYKTYCAGVRDAYHMVRAQLWCNVFGLPRPGDILTVKLLEGVPERLRQDIMNSKPDAQ
jgi:hypothetical protein